MQLQKLQDACGSDSSDYIYALGIVQHLIPFFGETLPLEHAIALIDILRYYSFHYSDGFTSNTSVEEVIGLADASAIVATFDDAPEHDWEWYRQTYWSFNHSSTQFAAIS